jgi:hypothetical protein
VNGKVSYSIAVEGCGALIEVTTGNAVALGREMKGSDVAMSIKLLV